MITDRLIRVDSIMAAKMQTKVTRSPVYFYVFDYDSPQGLKALLGEKEHRGESICLLPIKKSQELVKW